MSNEILVLAASGVDGRRIWFQKSACWQASIMLNFFRTPLSYIQLCHEAAV